MSEATTNGRLHQFRTHVNRAAATRIAALSTAIFTINHRTRVIPCVHASRWVPCSTSLATSGAPTKAPIRAGRIKNSGIRNWSFEY